MTTDTIRRFPELAQGPERPQEARGLLDLYAASRYLCCSPSYLEKLRKRGVLPGLLVTPKMRRWTLDQLNAYIRQLAERDGDAA